MRVRRWCTAVVGLTLLALAAGAALAQLPAFPGAEGFGAYTPGGRGGKVLLVTNLNDDGPGSLRAAITATGPRMVVFRVSGIIKLESDLSIRNPYLTVAGQSAPGDGLCLVGRPITVRTHNVILRYLRCRPGDIARKEMDALSVGPARNVIIDHCSTSWAIDETLSVTRDSQNVTVQWCIISESLNRSFHQKGSHGYGSLIAGEAGGITFHHNLYAHHNSRNPRPGGYEGKQGIILDFRNNLIYDWGMTCGYTGQTRVRINYVGNYLKAGPSAWERNRRFAFNPGGLLTQLYVAGNCLEGCPAQSRDNWLMIKPLDRVNAATQARMRMSQPFPAAPVTTQTAQAAYEAILAGAGASLPRRDAVDARLMEEVRQGGGRIINSQADVGGWPEYASAPAPPDADADGMPDEWEARYRLQPGDGADSATDADGDGYTNIEEYLNGTDPRVPEPAG